MTTLTTAAVSHVGKIRSNNQDSGYSGTHLFLVADGVGGHAGGDVASAIAAKRIAEADGEYPSAVDAEFALQSALVSANQQLAETVFEHAELTGMGTTVTAIMHVREQLVMAHIGDSRLYLLREGELSQISADHTFVQRLVDSGRITPEEAAVHPRRSVLMRVLGDVDANPEIDTQTLDTRPGDRWLLCSDGLSSYVPTEKITEVLQEDRDTEQAAFRLVKESLDHGAPDNVTVVLVDVHPGSEPPAPQRNFVGSAAVPLTFDAGGTRRPLRLPTLLLHPLKSTQPDPSHFEPESDAYLEELILEDRRRARRRRTVWLAVVIAALLVVSATVLGGYLWTQTRYYLAPYQQNVAIYQGIQQKIGPISLSSVRQASNIKLAALPTAQRDAVERTISADSYDDALTKLDALQNTASGSQ